MVKKTLKCLSLITSTMFAMANILIAKAGNMPSSEIGKSDMPRSYSLPTMSSATRANTQNSYFLYPADDSILKKYMKKRGSFQITELPPTIEKTIRDLVRTGVRVLDMEKTTGKTGTHELTFVKDSYCDGDTASITEFVDKLLETRTISATAPASASITCRYPDFIVNAYTTIHSNKLLNYSQQLKALQMIFAGLKKHHKYMLDESHTERLLELDPNQVTNLAVTLIRTPIGPILQPGDFAILIEFPDISILYTIR